MKIPIIAVAGPSGSGKKTIAREIDKRYGAEQFLTISSGNYYKDLRHLSAEEQNEVNFDHPNSIDFELLAQHIQLLKHGKSVDIPIYDFATHARQEQTLRVDPKAIIIIEDNFILHPACLTPLYDTIFFDLTSLFAHLDSKTTSPQHTHLGFFANPDETDETDETYEAGYTYFT